MRLNADIDICNLVIHSTNIRERRAWSKGWLSVGKKSMQDSQALIMVCTKYNKHGTHYKIRDNVVKIFDTFVNEGKCTIRMKEPPHDILINKADRMQLILFLNSLRTSLKYDQPNMLPLLAPLTSQEISTSKKKMVITSRREYPILDDFPSSLEDLAACSIGLKTIDKRLFSLKFLQHLDLSDNIIETLPDVWGTENSLVNLNLSNNKITTLPLGMLYSCSNLVNLNVHNNRIASLPPEIWKLTKLATLRLSNNCLKCLPPGINQLQNLTSLDLSNNSIFMYPGDICKLGNLDSIDVSNNLGYDISRAEEFFRTINPLPSHFEFKIADNSYMLYNIDRLFNVPKLVELAARSIKNFKLTYTLEDVGHMMSYLDTDSHECHTCKQCCFRNFGIVLKKVSLNSISRMVVGPREALCQFYVCSLKCFQAIK